MIRKYRDVEKENCSSNIEEKDKLNYSDTVTGKSLKTLREKDEIKTYCRIRYVENDPGLFKNDESDNKTLILTEDGKETKKYHFTKVFNSNEKQEALFYDICQPMINDLLNSRKSGLIFAYGITNSGKTYTITGTQSDQGLLPYSLKYIWDQLVKDPGRQAQLSVNFVEIYNETVFDLLSQEKRKKLEIKEKENKSFYLKNVTHVAITSLNQLNELLNTGLTRKIHAATNLNPCSSRSHSIFKIIVSGESEEFSLSIVDLAGSEKVSRSETTGKEFKETCNINQSLSTLTFCLKNMSYNSKYTTGRKPIPYRDSELTKLFMEYFQSGQNISMIVNINPSREDLVESLNVLNYACLSREIKPARCRVITINSNFSNQKKKVKNNEYKDANKQTNSIFTSDFSDFSEEDNSYLKNNINTSIVFSNNPNINSTPLKIATEDNSVLNKKIEQLEKQNEEMRISMIKSNYELQIANLSLKNELITMIANQWTQISTLPYSNSFLKALESRNSIQESQINYLPNPFLTTPKKRLSLQPELQSQRINSFVINLEKSKRKTICMSESKEISLPINEVSKKNHVEENDASTFNLSPVDTNLETNKNKKKKYNKNEGKSSLLYEEENRSSSEQDESNITENNIKKKKKNKSRSMDKSITDEEKISIGESYISIQEEPKKKKNAKKSKLVNEEIKTEEDLNLNKLKQTKYSIILEEENEQERVSISNEKKKPKKGKSRKNKKK